jgi:hypothetical protein
VSFHDDDAPLCENRSVSQSKPDSPNDEKKQDPIGRIEKKKENAARKGSIASLKIERSATGTCKQCSALSHGGY